MGHRHDSPAQLAAARANLVLARGARTKRGHRPATGAALAADLRNLAKARLVEARLPRTAKQLAASRANLAKARAHRHTHGTHLTPAGRARFVRVHGPRQHYNRRRYHYMLRRHHRLLPRYHRVLHHRRKHTYKLTTGTRRL